MSYELHENSVRRLTDNAFIPMDPANRDYREYLEWVAAGNVPLIPPSPAPVVPHTVSMRQARLALLREGVLQQVETVIDSLPEPDRSRVKIEWEYSPTLEYEWETVQQLAYILEWSKEYLDHLFTLADSL